MGDALLSSLGNLLAPPSQVVPGITAPPADEQKKQSLHSLTSEEEETKIVEEDKFQL